MALTPQQRTSLEIQADEFVRQLGAKYSDAATLTRDFVMSSKFPESLWLQFVNDRDFGPLDAWLEQPS